MNAWVCVVGEKTDGKRLTAADKDGDGASARREFLGDNKQFEMLDANLDGIIDRLEGTSFKERYSRVSTSISRVSQTPLSIALWPRRFRWRPTSGNRRQVDTSQADQYPSEIEMH